MRNIRTNKLNEWAEPACSLNLRKLSVFQMMVGNHDFELPQQRVAIEPVLPTIKYFLTNNTTVHQS